MVGSKISLNARPGVLIRTRTGISFFQPALGAVILLLAGTLLYPDTFSSLGFHFDGFRISATLILFIIALPPVGFYAWWLRRSIRLGIIDAFLLAYVAFVTVRGLFAGLHGDELALLVGFACYTIMLYYGIAILAQKNAALRAVFFSLAILGVIIASYAIVEFVAGYNILYGGITAIKVPENLASAGYHRSSSTIGHPVVLGIILVQIIPFLVFYFIRAASFIRRLFWGLAMTVTASALLVTFAKSSWVTALLLLILGIILYIWRRPQFSKQLKAAFTIFTLLCILIITTLGVIGFQDLKYNTFSNQRQRESYDLRWSMWANSLTVIKSHPMMGVGMWEGAADVYKILVQKKEAIRGGNAAISDIYISTLVEEGLIGFILFLLVIFLFSTQAWKMIRINSDHSIFVLTAFFGLMAVLIDGLVTESIVLWPCMVVFWTTAGLIRAQAERQRINE